MESKYHLDLKLKLSYSSDNEDRRRNSNKDKSKGDFFATFGDIENTTTITPVDGKLFRFVLSCPNGVQADITRMREFKKALRYFDRHIQSFEQVDPTDIEEEKQ